MKRQRMADRASHTWAEVTKRSEAMEEVIAIMGQFLEADSDISSEVAIFAIIGAIETRTGHEFLEPKENPDGATGVRTHPEE
jgi:hypothetical protein